MLVWCIILFGLGVFAFLDSLFTYGEVFRRVNSFLFMLVSLGLLIRTAIKSRRRTIERYREQIEWLEQKVEELQPDTEQPAPARKADSVKA